MNVMPERIRERLVALGKDPSDGGQTWLAREVDMKPQGIQSIMAGGVKRPRKLREIAAALNTTEDFLLGEGEHISVAKGPTPEMAIRLADLFADLMKAPIDLQFQVISYAEGRLQSLQKKSRDTDT